MELIAIYYISGKDNKYHISLSLLLPTRHSIRTYPNTLNHMSRFQEKKKQGKKKVSLLCKYFPFSSNSHLETDLFLILIGLHFKRSHISGVFLHIKLLQFQSANLQLCKVKIREQFH